MYISNLRIFYICFAICFSIYFFSPSSTLSALNPQKKITQYTIKPWNIDAGLTNNMVYAIHQTYDGYIWLGTQDGLVRFDGIDFQPQEIKSMPHSSTQCKVRALYEDITHTLWIGTDSKGLIYYKNGEFLPYHYKKNNSLTKISSINQDKNGNLWIGSFKSGLTYITGNQLKTFTTKEGLPSNEVNSIYKDENNDLWITTSLGIAKIIEPGVFQNYPLKEEIKQLKVVSLFEEDTDTLWIGTGAGFLLRLKDCTLTNYAKRQGILHPTINCLFRDKDKNLWIGTDGGGLCRMRRSDGIVSNFPNGHDLNNCSVYSIYEDREGSLWIGTLDKGLFQLRDSKFTTITTNEGLVHNDTQCIYEDPFTNDLWFGTKGGLSLFKNSKITTIFTSKNGLLDNSVTCLRTDQKKTLWIGTWGGLHKLEDGKLIYFTTQDGLSDNHINCIYTDPEGYIWVGTENGLNRIDSNGNCTIFTTEQGLSDNSVRTIFEDNNRNLLVGTKRNLHQYKEGKITPFEFTSKISSKAYSCIYEDKQGILWIGTESGLLRVNQENFPPSIFTVESGLIDNHISSILEDEVGFVWLGGSNGISRIEKSKFEEIINGGLKELSPIHYTEFDGMESRWCNSQAIKTQDGLFWFPTFIGAVVINPQQLEINTTPPLIIIEKLVADGEPKYIYNKTPKNQSLVLDAGIKRLEFYYSARTFINPQNINFKSKLIGFDNDWINMGKMRKTTYTGLPPGNYTFEVAAIDPNSPDSLWNKDIPILSFYKKPSFTQTPIFIVMVILSIGILILAIHLIRIRQLKIRKKQLEELVTIRTRDLHDRNLQLEQAHRNLKHSKEMIETKNFQLESQTGQLKEQSERLKEMDRVKNRFFTNISHEFRTPLTLIMGPLEQMLSEDSEIPAKEQKRKMELMLRNTQRLLGLINQLLELSKYESGKVKLQARNRNIIPFLKGIVANFETLAEQRELELHFTSACEELFIYVDDAKVQEIMENLLVNAMKFTPPGGKITVDLSCITIKNQDKPWDFLRISICDTGPGIPREQLLHIFDRFYQSETNYEHRRQGTGVGLALVKELVQLHNGTIDVYSHEGKGTEFILSLPMGNSHLKPGEILESSTEKSKDRLQYTAPTAPSHLSHLYQISTPELKESSEESRYEIEEAKDNQRDPLKEEKEIILIIEDSRDVREYIRDALLTTYSVIEAHNGKLGLQKARETIPDLIISDIMMPELDGLELCKILKTNLETSHIPIILLTAKASEAGIIQGLETGADDYITKPFSTRILLARIKNLIEIRRQFQLNLNREMLLQPVKESLSLLDKEFLKSLRLAIRQNLSDEEFNVEKLAKELKMDRSTVYRKVLALTGEAPTEFIRSCRLKRGAELLKSNFGTVLEVALEVGFSSANYFTKCFKKKFHQLPSTFQASESD